ncbi:pyridoxal phosphate-dependent aminotransferase [Rhodoplanes sp. TEM]|uniref:Pyridoxal phosphate-dependent aminotransferase n=1 Tax=Rhodoplanes tepidamans TaxID=200616 RepID=A0ABT5JAT3_RHOTP|nr:MULTISPECIES: pyridoxal phosphate-dependent aminotransferase [Rhodoplanes]MDC7786793.1 pyridoxal phosphate-dependent aminotransferase [Rhodoplanes tepidamans]MDC7987843.1 pyridoxal phosphate-dependent aminotransferase [Rhodoplanes sp. TEM]MDQ0355920.1 histidinol-phosphate aminotransferase [Rhodoplanes tepidamans]
MPARFTAARFTALVDSLPATVPFVGPETQERARGKVFRARIGANENAFGPSPKAVAAMQAEAAEAWKYCDPESHDLRHAVAAAHGVSPANVHVGEGIDGILGLVVRMLVEPGMPVVSSLGAYPTFNFHVAGFGGRLVTVPYRDDREDPQALVDAVRREKAPLVYIANPDNPMGTWWPAGDIRRMVEAVPDGTLLLLDEAYAEFAPDGVSPVLDPDDPRVLRLRTFSKAHGLAGIRVGYAIGAPALIAGFDKVRNHFGISRVSQAGALAAIRDADHVPRVRGAVAAARDRIGEIARRNGLSPLPSATNFVTVDCGRDGAFARRVLQALVARDVFVRMPGVAPLDRCIRIGCGRPGELDILADELPAALAEAARA